MAKVRASRAARTNQPHHHFTLTQGSSVADLSGALAAMASAIVTTVNCSFIGSYPLKEESDGVWREDAAHGLSAAVVDFVCPANT